MRIAVAVVPAVVGLHAEDQHGGCGFCGTAWPCDSIDSVHRTMQDPEAAALHRRAG